MCKRKVGEALEINRLKTLNETDKTFKNGFLKVKPKYYYLLIIACI